MIDRDTLRAMVVREIRKQAASLPLTPEGNEVAARLQRHADTIESNGVKLEAPRTIH